MKAMSPNRDVEPSTGQGSQVSLLATYCPSINADSAVKSLFDQMILLGDSLFEYSTFQEKDFALIPAIQQGETTVPWEISFVQIYLLYGNYVFHFLRRLQSMFDAWILSTEAKGMSPTVRSPVMV